MKYRAKYLPTAIISFIGGTYTMLVLMGTIISTFEPDSHPAMILAVLALMALTPLFYTTSGYYFHKWLEWKKPTPRDCARLIEGAKTGWKSPVTGITYPYHGHESSTKGPANED